jgi:two-component sensor histidine kinase
VGYTEYRIKRQDTGEMRWLARRGEIITDEAGMPVRVVGAVYDITERKRSEEQQRLLMAELGHRVKNTLAMVQAIASQTMRNATSLDDARDTFTSRLTNLAHAHDALMQENWASASIETVVSGAMRSHNHQARISWQGPDVRLGPRAALALSLALHELGTNATKYGALSVPDGRVVIVWTIAENADDRQFRFEWKEAGGPAVTPPTRKGFGSRLIERELATSLGGDVRISYEATGLILRLAAPLSALQDKSRISGGSSDSA